MAITKVQHTTGAGATLTLNGVAAGSTLVLFESYFRDGTNIAPSTPTDTQGTWSVAKADLPGANGSLNSGFACFYQKNVASGTHTVTPDGLSGHNSTLVEFSGLDTTTPLGVTNSAITNAGSFTSQVTGTTSATTVANALVCIGLGLACSGGSSNVGFTDPVTGFTTLQTVVNDLTDIGTFHAYKIVSATGTQGATFNWTDAEGGQFAGAAVVTFYAPSGAYTLTAAQGSYSLTGQAAGLTATHNPITAAQGSYALTGQDILLSYNAARIMTADAGTYFIIGSDALVDTSMNAEQGTYTLSGQDVTLTYTQLNAFSITASQGSYSLTGQDSILLFGRAIPVTTGNYTLSGFATALLWSGAGGGGGPGNYKYGRLSLSQIRIGL